MFILSRKIRKMEGVQDIKGTWGWESDELKEIKTYLRAFGRSAVFHSFVTLSRSHLLIIFRFRTL